MTKKLKRRLKEKPKKMHLKKTKLQTAPSKVTPMNGLHN